jgi:ribonuclease BN (tRNA processing enzyme)
MSFYDIQRDMFAAIVNEAADMHKGPDIFWRNTRANVDELRILRRWNSSSPSVADVFGGGYFLRWKGMGTIIDPGCSFLRLFRHWTDFSFNDINMVIVTHDHVDHCQDFGPLISMFRQFNNWRVKKFGIPPNIWDAVISYGVADQFTSLLNHPDNAPFLFWRKVLAVQEHKVECSQDVPGFLISAGKNNLLEGDSQLSAFLQRATMRFIDRYHFELHALPAKHKELLGSYTAFGLRFALGETAKEIDTQKQICSIAISGDTALREHDEVLRDYGQSELLVLHVGTMEKTGEAYTGDHLCFNGVVSILDAIARQPSIVLKLVVFTEWGYEFGRLGLNGRTQFVRLVCNELNRRSGLNRKYHAAVADDSGYFRPCPEEVIVLIPADIGLRVRLPDLSIFVPSASEKGEFISFKEVYAMESIEQIDYMPIL